MSDPPAPNDERVRFPYVAAVFCAACVGAAGFLWMRYSFCWDATGWDLGRARPGLGGPRRCYVRVQAELDQTPWHYSGDGTDYHTVRNRGNAAEWDYVVRLEPHMVPAARTGRVVTGRVELLTDFVLADVVRGSFRRAPFVIDTQQGRLTGASIAGLVVGAWGVLIFALAFRHWLRGRKTAAPFLDRADTRSQNRASTPEEQG